MTRLTGLLIAAAIVALSGATPAGAAPRWALELPAPPVGAAFSGPVGAPADVQFLAPNFGLMMVTNQPGSAYRSGLFVYDGFSWRQLSTVCGGAARSGRIALVSEREWWTVSDPAPGLDGLVPQVGTVTLCRFVDGKVVASYATAEGDLSGTPYPPMNAAACAGPNHCWFGGPVTDVPAYGTFLLRWDGAGLTPIQEGSARGIADLQAYGGQVIAGTAVGTGFDQAAQSLVDASDLGVPRDLDLLERDGPRLLRTLHADGGASVLDWPRLQGTQRIDIAALDADGGELWVAGRASTTAVGETSSPDDPEPRLPYLARQIPGQTEPVEIAIEAGAGLTADDRIGDIAVVPGGGRAWVTLHRGGSPVTSRTAATVVLIDASGAVLQRVDLGREDVAVGDAARIDCPAADQCWMVTAGGWIFRLSEPGLTLSRHPSPAIQRLITQRPPDVRTPRTPPDTVPVDEGTRYVAPEVEAPQEQAAASEPKPLPALLRVLGRARVTNKGRTITMRIQVRRRARIQLQGLRRGRVVARTTRKTYKPGRYTLRMKVTRKRWPTSLRFRTTDLELPAAATPDEDAGGGAGDTLIT